MLTIFTNITNKSTRYTIGNEKDIELLSRKKNEVTLAI